MIDNLFVCKDITIKTKNVNIFIHKSSQNSYLLNINHLKSSSKTSLLLNSSDLFVKIKCTAFFFVK